MTYLKHDEHIVDADGEDQKRHNDEDGQKAKTGLQISKFHKIYKSCKIL